MYILSSIVSLLTLSSLAAADCCKSSSPCSTWEVLFGGYCPASCNDGSAPTPCCGKGNCNAFCCDCNGGCQGSKTIMSNRQQVRLGRAQAPYSYDSTFDEVSGVGSEEISLADYLVWAGQYQPASISNSTLTQAWIEYFHSFDQDGDGKLRIDEIHRPVALKTKLDL